MSFAPAVSIESSGGMPPQVLDSVPVGICLLASDYTILAWNRTLAEWTGLSASEALHKRLTELFPSLQEPKYKHRLDAVFATGAPAAFSAALHHHFIPAELRNDDRLMVQDTSVRLISRNPPQALVTIQDVTLAARQLESLRRDRKALQETANALELTNSLLQLKMAEASSTNRRLSDEIHERNRVERELRLQAAQLREAQSREVEHAAQLEEFVVELSAARQAALTATQSKSDFLANMSHEIRTPMTAILGYVDLLQDAMCPADERQHAIQTIHRNGEHLLAIINDILDLSKIEAGKMAVERIVTAPKEIISDVCHLTSGRAQKQDITLSADVDAAIPLRILIDPTRLQQILVNLVGNAIKFTKAGAVKVAADWIDVGSQEGILRVHVTDTGIGICPEKLTNLFQPFTQADSGTSRQFGGTGLGLVISQRLARLMGGDLVADSRMGVGTTFTLTVLCGLCCSEEVDLVTRRSAPDQLGTELHHVHVLVADDSPDNQKLLAYNLRKVGATFEIAGNGQTAVEMVAAAELSHPFDVILMDIQMPLLDGYAATRQLRSLGHRTPVIALTANAMEGDRIKCLEAGCDDYVTKPINRKQLIGTIGRWSKRFRDTAVVIKDQSSISAL